ncbi:hypothetical protein HMN09_00412100 [Mycena chlorophos]|uniref:Uncharacterized protein n=1 Tax=Mycena chlorophos TaxID=658473 RepID=A0A8H6TDF8_MYCCL|nr:hypothetical protein HMN09_00412100 [Mycena chlorophos]
MPFPFTFTLGVPGGLNPFSAPSEPANATAGGSEAAASTQAQASPSKHRAQPARHSNVHDRRPSPAPPLTRKRGWDPSMAEPSQSSATLAQSSGYLDTPAKYRELASQQDVEFELDDMNIVEASDLPPPAKRRRTLAGSIVSTAVSAALIGTAVGLTVYRLWRDRGKEAEPPQIEPPPPPPPYQESEWKPIQRPQPIQITPASPPPTITPRRRKVRNGVGAASATRRQHRARPSTSTNSFNPVFSPHQSLIVPTAEEPEASVEDQMDWMGDQLAQLIQEGQRALRSEVVVKSEVKEDEIDDGSGVWEEEEGGPSSFQSRSASPRQRKRPRNGLTLAPPTAYHHQSQASRPSSASPRNQTRFEFGSLPSSSSSAAPKFRTDEFGSLRGTSEFGGRAGAAPTGAEDEMSAELRESMRRARERVLAMRTTG